MTAAPPVFTAIVDTFYRPAMLKEAVDALRRQTHRDMEIILVDNAATPQTKDYLRAVTAEDSRVKLVRFEENQYSPEDPLKMLDTCLNAALKEATGDFVWYQSDDDYVSDDYAEKMVALFIENPDCVTAAGLPVAVDAGGLRLDPQPRRSNYRPRFMPGRILAQEVLRGGRTMFSAPGTIFTVRREALVKAGGYHRAIELSQLYGIVPFGVTGFDETAVLYWRRHEGQLNKQISARGWLATDETRNLLRDWKISERWEVFGKAAAHEVADCIEKQISRTSGIWFINNLLALRPVACARIARKACCRPAFWGYAFTYLLDQIRKKSSRIAPRLRRLLNAPNTEPAHRTPH